MKKPFISLIALMIMSSCAYSSSFYADGKEFYLTNNANTCQLVDQSSSDRFNFRIPWPCQVHRGTDGKVRIYENAGKKYFLVENSVPHPELPNDCKTQLQAVMIEGDTVKLSELSDTVASCPPFQWDAKVFIGLFD